MKINLNTVKSISVVSVLVCVFSAAGALAQVQSPAGECRARIGLVQGDLDDIKNKGDIGGGNPSQTYAGLSSKLDGAVQKLQQGKNADAKQKLQDFKDAVVLMREKKISSVGAYLLLDGDGNAGDLSGIDEGVNGAISCVCLLP